MVEERNKNGKFKNIIDFMNRVSKDVLNKRQLEKLIQAGAFDSIEFNRSKLFSLVNFYYKIFELFKVSYLTVVFTNLLKIHKPTVSCIPIL